MTANGARLIGVDLARFLAIVGMMAAHLLVPIREGITGVRGDWLDILTSGYPSALFAVLGGFGVVFASRKFTGTAAVMNVAARGVVVFAIGWLLELLPDHNIAVVLIYFGTAIMVAACFVLAPTWVLVSAAAIIGLVGSQLIPWYRLNVFTGEYAGILQYDSLSGFWGSVFLTGTYPVVTWTVYLLIGMVLARWILSWRQQGRLVGAAAWMTACGALVAAATKIVSEIYLLRYLLPSAHQKYGIPEAQLLEMFRESRHGSGLEVGWSAVFFGAPHSGTVMDIVHSAAVAATVIGVCLLATSALARVPIWLAPFVAAGSAPLTIYVLHICMTAFSMDVNSAYSLAPPLIARWAFWWQLAVVIGVGIILAASKRRGPLEYLTTSAARTASQISTPADSRTAGQ